MAPSVSTYVSILLLARAAFANTKFHFYSSRVCLDSELILPRESQYVPARDDVCHQAPSETYGMKLVSALEHGCTVLAYADIACSVPAGSISYPTATDCFTTNWVSPESGQDETFNENIDRIAVLVHPQQTHVIGSWRVACDIFDSTDATSKTKVSTTSTEAGYNENRPRFPNPFLNLSPVNSGPTVSSTPVNASNSTGSGPVWHGSWHWGERGRVSPVRHSHADHMIHHAGHRPHHARQLFESSELRNLDQRADLNAQINPVVSIQASVQASAIASVQIGSRTSTNSRITTRTTDKSTFKTSSKTSTTTTYRTSRRTTTRTTARIKTTTTRPTTTTRATSTINSVSTISKLSMTTSTTNRIIINVQASASLSLNLETEVGIERPVTILLPRLHQHKHRQRRQQTASETASPISAIDSLATLASSALSVHASALSSAIDANILASSSLNGGAGELSSLLISAETTVSSAAAATTTAIILSSSGASNDTVTGFTTPTKSKGSGVVATGAAVPLHAYGMLFESDSAASRLMSVAGFSTLLIALAL